MTLEDKKKLLELVREYNIEKCTAEKGECGDDFVDACPFNEGADEGQHRCGLHTIASELGADIGDEWTVHDELEKLRDELWEKNYDGEED